MTKPKTADAAEDVSMLRRRLDSVRAIEAIREWERRRRLLEKARTTYEALGDQSAKNRYEREWDAYKAARNFAISMLTPLGKKLTIDGFHYRSIPSRLEIKKTPCKR